MNNASHNRLNKVHPELARRVMLLIQALADKGYTVEVVQGLRTFAEQDELYKQGRTKPGQVVTKARGGQSNHNYGLAVDLCPFVNGKPQWNDNQGFIRIGVEAAKVGLEWGGQLEKVYRQTARSNARAYHRAMSGVLKQGRPCQRLGQSAPDWR